MLLNIGLRICCKLLLTIIPLVWNIFDIGIYSKLHLISPTHFERHLFKMKDFLFYETSDCLFAILCTMLLMTIFRDSIRVFLFFIACYILINSTITYENKGRIRMRDILDYKFISGFVITMYIKGRFSAMI